MTTLARTFLAFWIIAAGAFYSASTAASNCPTPRPLLQPNRSDVLIADITVLRKLPSESTGTVVAEVSTVYAGSAPRVIAIDTNDIDLLDCTKPGLSAIPVGGRVMVRVHQDPVTGRYSSGYFDADLVIENEALRGFFVVPRDCAGNDPACPFDEQTVSLEEFRKLAATYYPDEFFEREVVSFARMDISLRSGKLVAGSEVALDFDTGSFCGDAEPNAVRLGVEDGIIDVSLNVFSRRLTDVEITPLPPCLPSQPRIVPIGRVFGPGEYTVRLYSESPLATEDRFLEENLFGELPLSVGETSFLANPETPVNGSIQSGIGLIRGWACDARSVFVQFDNLPPLQLAYGTARPDTAAACGDINNGYGTVFAWGSLGEGTHRMTTWIDGRRVSRVEFEVSGLGEPFLTGLSGEYELEEFPEAGESVLIRWSQPDQNFIIVDRQPSR